MSSLNISTLESQSVTRQHPTHSHIRNTLIELRKPHVQITADSISAALTKDYEASKPFKFLGFENHHEGKKRIMSTLITELKAKVPSTASEAKLVLTSTLNSIQRDINAATDQLSRFIPRIAQALYSAHSKQSEPPIPRTSPHTIENLQSIYSITAPEPNKSKVTQEIELYAKLQAEINKRTSSDHFKHTQYLYRGIASNAISCRIIPENPQISVPLPKGVPDGDPILLPNFPGETAACSLHPKNNQDRAGFYKSPNFTATVVCDGVSASIGTDGVMADGTQSATIIRNHVMRDIKSEAFNAVVTGIADAWDPNDINTCLMPLRTHFINALASMCQKIESNSATTLDISFQIQLPHGGRHLINLSFGDSGTVVYNPELGLKVLNPIYRGDEVGVIKPYSDLVGLPFLEKSVSDPGFILSRRAPLPYFEYMNIVHTPLSEKDVIISASDGLWDAMSHVGTVLVDERSYMKSRFSKSLLKCTLDYADITNLSEKQTAQLLMAVATIVSQKPDDITIVVQKITE